MKNVLIAIVVLALLVGAVFLFDSDMMEDAAHPGKTNVAGAWVDDDEIAKYNFNFAGSEDTYCKKCKKYMEGKKRICTFCGQYIN